MKQLVMKLLGYLITLLMIATPIVGVASDRTIEETIAARLALMKLVAHSKWVTGRAIEDTDREKVVIEQAVISGLQYGITTDSTTTFFEAQIEAAKAIQRYWFNVWQDEPPKGLAPDLTATIRPQLLELGDQILSQLGTDNRSLTFTRFQKATQIEGLPLAHQQALFQALLGIERYPSRWQQIQKSRILRVGTTLDYAPFSYLSEGGEREGLDIVLATQLAESLGARLVWVRTSWPTLMKDFRSGAFDVGMSGISIIPSRAREGFFTTAYHEGGKTPITQCNLKNRFTSLDAIDRAGVRVIVNPGGTNERYVNTALEAATVVHHPDNETIFEALSAGKADLMITDAIEVLVMANRYDDLCPSMPGSLLTQQDKGWLLPKDSALLTRVEQFLGPLIESGELDRLKALAIERAAQIAH
ncbi:MAG: gamma subclass chorismate mutase AroQ [Pseudomonadota bacterium]|nr:gamma subclass chorismate mutase AroQ [Pseudomonadota bacterium]